jgi:hypothetical protein
MQSETQITIKISGKDPFELKKKVELCKEIGRLEAEDQDRILQLIGSNKALAALKKNWSMLSMMFK